jgi:hypothetical protein
MEVFGARPSEATDVCFQEIEESDALVGIYAHRYGYVPQGAASSITEQEFDFAREKAKQPFCFMVADDCPWLPRHIEGEPGRSKLAAFKARIRESFVTDVFSSPEDLAYKLAASLGRFLVTRKVKEGLEKISSGDKVSTPRGRSQVARRAARLQPLMQGARILLVNDAQRHAPSRG